jgi:hypothetical protein
MPIALPAGRRSSILLPARIQQLCILYMAAWCVSPPLMYGTGARVAFAISAVAWLVIELARFPTCVTLFTPSSGMAALFAGYVTFMLFMTSEMSDITALFQFFICLFFLLIAGAYNQRGWDELRQLLLPILLMSAFWAGSTLLGLSEDAHAARYVSRSSEIARDFLDSGVGGYSLVYYTLFPILVSLALALQRGPTRRWYRWTMAGCAAIMALMVMRAGYSIAVLILLASVVSFLLLRFWRLDFALIAVFLLAAIAILGSYFFQDIMRVLLSLTDGTEYYKKVWDISQNALYGGDKSFGTLAGRELRYQKSWDVFLDNPLFGAFSRRSLGGHSALLDMFAQFGVVVGAFAAYLLAIRPALLLRRGGGRALPVASGLAMAILIALNTLPLAVGFGLFLLVPLGYSALCTQRQEWVAVPMRFLTPAQMPGVPAE